MREGYTSGTVFVDREVQAQTQFVPIGLVNPPTPLAVERVRLRYRTAEPSSNQSTIQSINQPINQSINQPTNQPNNQTTKQPNNPPHPPTNQPTKQATMFSGDGLTGISHPASSLRGTEPPSASVLSARVWATKAVNFLATQPPASGAPSLRVLVF